MSFQPLYAQAIPIFLGSDSQILAYFRDHREEVDAITGTVIHVIVPKLLDAPDPKNIASAVYSERFPDLRTADIPCLWVESSNDAHFTVPLPQDLSGVKKLLYRLVDSFKAARSFEEAKQAFNAGLFEQAVAGTSQKHVLISLHGIRTRGSWQKELQTSCDLADAGLQHRPFDFGLFGALQLVFPPSRDRMVKWFLRKYQSLIKEEQLDRSLPSLIAHSFGTYVVAKAMEKYPEIRFRRVIFCGSIVHRSYDWSATVAGRQVERVLNDFGRQDVWVRAAQWVIADAGSSGYQGFTNTADGAVVQREHVHWKHSDYFYPLNYDKNWIPFIVGRSDPDEGQRNRPRPTNWRFRILMAVLAVLVIVAAWKLVQTNHPSNSPVPVTPQSRSTESCPVALGFGSATGFEARDWTRHIDVGDVRIQWDDKQPIVTFVSNEAGRLDKVTFLERQIPSCWAGRQVLFQTTFRYRNIQLHRDAQSNPKDSDFPGGVAHWRHIDRLGKESFTLIRDRFRIPEGTELSWTQKEIVWQMPSLANDVEEIVYRMGLQGASGSIEFKELHLLLQN